MEIDERIAQYYENVVCPLVRRIGYYEAIKSNPGAESEIACSIIINLKAKLKQQKEEFFELIAQLKEINNGK